VIEKEILKCPYHNNVIKKKNHYTARNQIMILSLSEKPKTTQVQAVTSVSILNPNIQKPLPFHRFVKHNTIKSQTSTLFSPTHLFFIQYQWIRAHSYGS